MYNTGKHTLTGCPRNVLFLRFITISIDDTFPVTSVRLTDIKIMYKKSNKLTNTQNTLIFKQHINNVNMDTSEGKIYLKFKKRYKLPLTRTGWIKTIHNWRITSNSINAYNQMPFFQDNQRKPFGLPTDRRPIDRH